jgi:multisubunit Na+/H+ antiporter MnhE subunit
MSAPPTVSANRKHRPLAVRAWNFACFILRFGRELVLANFAVAKTVLFQRREDLAPGFFDYDLKGLSPFEIVVLTHCITLTPGTASVEVSDDNSSLVVHALDARDPVAVRQSIKDGLEAPLLAWTRSHHP